MLILVMSQMAILNAASNKVGPRKRNIQDLTGQIIHDDGSSVHGRCNEKEFINGSLKKYSNVIVSGVTGTQESPLLGSVMDGEERLQRDVLLRYQNYGIDSPYQLLEVQGYKEDKSVDQYIKRYYKVVNGRTIEKLYFRKPEWTHFIRVNAMSTVDTQVNKILIKMTRIHKNMGHPKPEIMVKMCDAYDTGVLGFTKFEALIFQKHGSCKACLEGKTTKRRSDSKHSLIYQQYGNYGNMEGLHFDVFEINKQWHF